MGDWSGRRWKGMDSDLSSGYDNAGDGGGEPVSG